MANDKIESSALSQILIPIVIALLVGGTAPWWWEEFVKRDGDNHSPSPSIVPPPQTLPTNPITAKPNPLNSTSEIRLDWGNVTNFFLIDKVDLKRGYEKALSQLNFLVEAKGNFSGSMYAYVYDEDGVKICSTDLGLECYGYEFVITFSTKSNSFHDIFLSDPLLDDSYGGSALFNYPWQQGEVDRASLSIPYNAMKIEFVFIQRS